MRSFILLVILLYSSSLFAHGDHSAPGALPFAPHGGKIGAAEHADGDHDEKEHGEEHEDHKGPELASEGKEEHHEHEEEAELYFEGVYDAKSSLVEVYPLVIDPKSPKEFIQKSPSSDFKNVSGKIEFPRSKKVEAVSFEILKDEIKGERWVAKVPSNKDIRFFVHLSLLDGDEIKLGKVHLEKKR